MNSNANGNECVTGMRMRSRKDVFLGLTLAVAFAGCQRGSEWELFPADGQITQGNKPVPGATVAFHSSASPRIATGVTDDAGHFSLTTFEDGDGAVAAEYVVTVSQYAVDTSNVNTSSAMDDVAQQPGGATQVTNALPMMLADPATSPLRGNVTSQGPNNFRFDLNETSR